ncbi:hypothetical protein WICPIJ_001003 [Wickerhamomyces pijperi]|uniref:U3 small nucleolar RNA-associated protein 8 n=1 Tax=Wickerhamomyces pijperi TaxID=599730 RepID=A0A9P8TR76_WICPI|nr:hypothetical protein WICPIJ_001003 [Wickerhamomyces pijperi]
MSLTDIYQLTKLPRVSAELASLVQITSDSDSEFLKLGISGSSISKYVLKPSPRLIWSKSLAPGVAVGCIESYTVKTQIAKTTEDEEPKEEEDAQDEDEDKMDVDSEEPIEENKDEDIQDADQVEEEQEQQAQETVEQIDEYFVFGAYDKSKKRHTLQTLKVLPNDSELVHESVSASKILSLRVDQSSNSLIVITEEEIKGLDLTTYETKWSLKTLYVTEYVKYLANDIILVIEKSHSKSRSKANQFTKLNYRIVTLSGVEVNSKIIEHEGGNALSYKYDVVDGVLYQYFVESNEVVSYQLPHFTQLKSINLQTHFDIKQGEVVGINAPALDRVLIITKAGIHLLNIRFEIQLSFIESAKSIHSILSVEAPLRNNAGVINQAYQNFIVVSRGNEIAGLSYTLDSNTIRDSIGKQTASATASATINEIPSILNIPSTVAQAPTTELFDSSLSSFDFDKNLYTYLQATQGYYTDSDRIVTSSFITRCVDFIFATYSSTQLPERVLTYLLTHPLFPYLGDLLSRLRSSPRLLRQAIVTSNISLRELISELNTTENAEIFKDLITRILEFPKSSLGSEFKNLQTQRIIAKIIELDYGFELVSLLIDANGILMWDDVEYVDQLIALVEGKVSTLQGNQSLISVLDVLDGKSGLAEGVVVKKALPLYSVETLTFN